MRALQIKNQTRKPVFLDIAVPSISPKQILVKTKACGLNFADLLMI